MSGARLVHIGRPRARLDYFDLVLTTPQYRLPPTENVIELSGPLTTFNPETLTASAGPWGERFSHLPRPWFAVFIGGDTPTLRFPTSAASDLGFACNNLAASQNGSLLVTTSPRTSNQVANAFLAEVKVPSFCFRWQENADNPYAAFLALADQFIVTNDSISMTHEAALAGRPLHIFPIYGNDTLYRTALRRLDHRLRSQNNLIAKAYEGMIRRGLIYSPKSPADYFDRLIENGFAARIGRPLKETDFRPYAAETDRAVQSVRSLFLSEVDSEPQEKAWDKS